MKERLVVNVEPALTWGGSQEIVLVITDGDGYNAALQAMVRGAEQRFQGAVFITANRPQSILAPALERHGIDLSAVQFVDCISGMTGILPPNTPQTLFIESPTMLEKVGLRAEQMLRRRQGACLILDSLSTLAVYNGEPAVEEWVHNLVTRLRVNAMPAALLVVETQTETRLIESAMAHCDRTVRL